MAATVAQCTYSSPADIYHGRQTVPGSNHRLGLAIDFNDSNYPGVVDAPLNPLAGRSGYRTGRHA